MDLRSAMRLLIVAALLAAPAARAQFQPVLMKVPGWPRAELVPGHWSDPTGSSAGSDLLVVQASAATVGAMSTYRSLLPPWGADPYAAPAGVRAGALGAFDASAGGRVPDAAWGETNGLAVAWGQAPGATDAFPGLFAYFVDGMGAARLLPRPQPVALVVAGVHEIQLPDEPGLLYAVDLGAVRGTAATPPIRSWDVPTYDGAQDGDSSLDRAFPIRLSATARAAGLDDVFIPFQKGFYVLWHEAVPATASLADVDAIEVAFGVTTGGDLKPFLPASLASTFWYGSIFGGAAIPVDAADYPDAVPDLVFSYASELYPDQPGQILWIPNTGDPAEMATLPWRSLMGRGDLPVVDAGVLRQLDLGDGIPTFAVADRTLERIFVVRGGGAAGFTVTSLPADGVVVRDLVAVDVVGSPAKDLVALVDFPVGHPGYPGSEVWIYPDDGDRAPALSFVPGLPAAALLGADLSLGVAVDDPDAPLPPDTVTWLRPISPETVAATGTSWVVPGADLCTASTWDFKVRALDDWGVYTELTGSLPVEGRPSLRLAGDGGPLVLLPGGVAGRAEGEAWPGCQTAAPVYTWGQIGLSGLVETARQPDGDAAAWREFAIPESAYPEALGTTPSLTLAATGPTAGGTVSGSTELPLDLDARGLVAATVELDRAALSPGEVGRATVRVASRIAVALPDVRVSVRLSGLSFAGPIAISGAEGSAPAGSGEVTLPSLPAAPTVVQLDAPVRSLGSPGAVSVELYSAGGHRLSPEASPAVEGLRAPGCSCGAGGGGPAGPLLLLLAMALGRKRRPT